MVAVSLIIAGAIAGTILGVAFFIYDSNRQWTTRQQELAKTCLVDGGSWIPQYSQGMCIARVTKTDLVH